MSWNEKPYFKIYRLFTGTKYTLPYMNQKGYQIYWKDNPTIVNGIVYRNARSCKILNLISALRKIFYAQL